MLQVEGKSVLGIKGTSNTVQHVVVGTLSTIDLQRVAEHIGSVRSGAGDLLRHRQAVVCLSGIGECGLIGLFVAILHLNLLNHRSGGSRVVSRHSNRDLDVIRVGSVGNVGVRTRNLGQLELVNAGRLEIITLEQLLSGQLSARGITVISKLLPLCRQRTSFYILGQSRRLPGTDLVGARELNLERKRFRVVQLRVRRCSPGLVNSETVVLNRRCKRSARKSNHHGTSKCRRNHILLQAKHSHSLSFLPSRFLYPTQSQQGHNLALNHVDTYCTHLAAIDRLHASVTQHEVLPFAKR